MSFKETDADSPRQIKEYIANPEAFAVAAAPVAAGGDDAPAAAAEEDAPAKEDEEEEDDDMVSPARLSAAFIS